MTAFLSGTADDLKEELKKHVPHSKYGITNAQKVQSCTQDEFTEKEKEGLYDLVVIIYFAIFFLPVFGVFIIPCLSSRQTVFAVCYLKTLKH